MVCSGAAGTSSRAAKRAATERLDADLDAPTTTPTMAQDPQNEKTPVDTGVSKYRYRDSNPGFRRERAAS
jgi:hypothetical protein